jgi:MoxR-like ATPase
VVAAAELAPALTGSVGRVLLGDPAPVRLAVAAFVAGGHVLFEDTPGTGKTLLCKTLAAAIGGSFGRVQGTTDLLPSDVTGVSIYDAQRSVWEFRPGPVFHNVVLVDELNRATPRTQSALLEAMAEQQVTVDGTTNALPEPFFVIATQNPAGDLGTFPLVAGQRDRFMVSVSLGPPGRAAELRLVRGDGGEPRLGSVTPIVALDRWIAVRGHLDAIHLSDVVANYGLDVIDATRRRVGSAHAISTRAVLALLRVARGHAVACGRTYVSPDDVQAVAPAALAHRLLDVTNGNLAAARQLVVEAGSTVAVPPRA